MSTRANPEGSERDAALAALLSFLEHLTTRATVIVVTGQGSVNTFQIDPPDSTPADLRADVLRFLEDRAGPMTLNQLMDSFEAEGTTVSDRTVKRHLRELTAEGKVENLRHAGTPGYRLKAPRP